MEKTLREKAQQFLGTGSPSRQNMQLALLAYIAIQGHFQDCRRCCFEGSTNGSRYSKEEPVPWSMLTHMLLIPAQELLTCMMFILLKNPGSPQPRRLSAKSSTRTPRTLQTLSPKSIRPSPQPHTHESPMPCSAQTPWKVRTPRPWKSVQLQDLELLALPKVRLDFIDLLGLWLSLERGLGFLRGRNEIVLCTSRFHKHVQQREDPGKYFPSRTWLCRPLGHRLRWALMFEWLLLP